MNKSPSSPNPPLKDRSVGLILFGIFTIGLGGVCALVVPLMRFGIAMAARSGQPTNASQLGLVSGVYGILAVALIWLGVGSILRRRWARALLLIGSWSWLIVGLISLISMAFMIRPMLETMQQTSPKLDSSMLWIILLIQGAMLLLIFLILPAIWLFFYRSPHVKATCEYLDPVVRWTDRCPLPVLAGVLWMASSALTSVIMIVFGPAVLPVFGEFVTGTPAKVILAVTTLFWAYGTRAFYRLDRRGWWIAIVLIAAFMISAVVTYSVRDIMEIYPKLGYSPEQIAQMAKFNFMKGTTMSWLTALWCIPVFGYLIYLRRFFPRVIIESKE